MANIDLADIRKDYKMATLSEQDVSDDPFLQFEKWFLPLLHKFCLDLWDQQPSCFYLEKASHRVGFRANLQ